MPINCPRCGKEYPDGTLVCPEDAELLDPEQFERSVIVPAADIEVEQPGNMLLPVARDNRPRFVLMELNGRRFDDEAEAPRLALPIDKMILGWVTLGRSDPAIMTNLPDIDFDKLLKIHCPNDQYPVSRMHASLRWHNGLIQLRAGERAATWQRRTGSPNRALLRAWGLANLAARDEIILGNPGKSNLRLRFVL
ncbi:MAG: hypothetical protein ABIG32_03405 [Candidatus Uhrbacteria bacterium]